MNTNTEMNIGAHIDLSYINKRPVVATRKSTQEKVEHLIAVGSQFINTSQGQVKMALRIPVMAI